MLFLPAPIAHPSVHLGLPQGDGFVCFLGDLNSDRAFSRSFALLPFRFSPSRLTLFASRPRVFARPLAPKVRRGRAGLKPRLIASAVDKNLARITAKEEREVEDCRCWVARQGGHAST